MYLKDRVTKEDVQRVISETNTMGGAAKKLNLDHRTFKTIAQQYGLFKPVKANRFGVQYKIEDIFNETPTFKGKNKKLKNEQRKLEA